MVFYRSSTAATAIFLALFTHTAYGGKFCDEFVCLYSDYREDHPSTIQCPDDICTVGFCCEDVFCDTFDCADRQLVEHPNNVECPDGACSVDLCCQEECVGGVEGGTPCGGEDCGCWDGACVCATCDSFPTCPDNTNVGAGTNCLAGLCTPQVCCNPPVCGDGYPDCLTGFECVEGACEPRQCADGTWACEDPHLKGLRGQRIDWSGVDGGWYSLVKDDAADIQVNLRVTAPLPVEFPERQLITGLSVLSAGHSLVIEVKNPYAVDPANCPEGVSPCLANGGIRAVVDGVQQDGLLRSLRKETVAEGMAVSASNLPVECRQFGGAKIWARLYEEMLQGRRELAVEDVFEDWVLSFHTMAAPDWCTRFIDQHSLEDVQSVHAVFKIETPWNTVRLNVGTNQQGDGELNWDGRVLPDLEFWQMDVGMDGLSLENKALSGLLGETARPVIGADGHPVMEGDGAFRGTIEDYRVDGPLGTDFALLHQ